MKQITNSILAPLVVLVIAIDAVNAVRYLPYLLSRRSDNHLDHHKLIKEINELELSHSSVDKPQPRPALASDSSQASSRRPSTRKREFKLNEFTLDDLLIKGSGEQDSPKLGWHFLDIPDRSLNAADESTRSRPSVSNCGKTRVAAGASGYLRLSCMEGTATRVPTTAPALDASNLNLFHPLENAQFKRLNSDFELLVDTLNSPGAEARDRS